MTIFPTLVYYNFVLFVDINVGSSGISLLLFAVGTLVSLKYKVMIWFCTVYVQKIGKHRHVKVI